jgi:hypothetical protein
VVKYGGALKMDSLLSPIAVVDKELFTIFDSTTNFCNVYDMHTISELTKFDRLIIDIVLAQHMWTLTNYLDKSVINWIL